MSPRWFIVSIMSGILMTSCAKRVPEPATLVPGTPHVTWVLMYGDRDTPDREFACQSDPMSECALPASRPDAQTFADLHFYFHGAGNETRYEGTMSIGFLQEGGGPHVSPANITVKKNESISNQSLVGIVTTAPGLYVVTLDMTGTVTDTGKRQPVRESLPVRVQ